MRARGSQAPVWAGQQHEVDTENSCSPMSLQKLDILLTPMGSAVTRLVQSFGPYHFEVLVLAEFGTW